MDKTELLRKPDIFPLRPTSLETSFVQYCIYNAGKKKLFPISPQGPQNTSRNTRMNNIYINIYNFERAGSKLFQPGRKVPVGNVHGIPVPCTQLFLALTSKEQFASVALLLGGRET